ncbi:MAG TPA: putative porin [Chitinophagaceae bacterium]
MGGGGGGDSLKRRDKNEDSITIRFRYLDSSRQNLLDSSVSDFTRRFPIPGTNIFLGNTGTASRSILFSPALRPGWDPGFHSFDAYKWMPEKARFFHTTRPYSEVSYQLASRSEQLIELMHTQNIKPNWNFLMQYRLINAPGMFNNQKTNHNNYLITSRYESVNKRYTNYLILAVNNLQSGENGGLVDVNDLDDPDLNDRYVIPTKLGGEPDNSRNFFNTDVGTGNRYREATILFRQQYDLGRKDSLVTDSTVIPLFYPRLRFEHTFQYRQLRYQFRDYIGDSAYYKDYYGIDFANPIDTFEAKDQWKEFVNDFSIYQFPDAKNLQQFIKLGAALQNLKQEDPVSKADYNIFGHVEYRNRTRDRKWDIEANGKLYFAGLNAGDYSVYASLQRATSKKLGGYAQLGFENVNREPSSIYTGRSDFYLLPVATSFKKENTTHLFASLYQSSLKLKLSGHYYLLTNYSYIQNFYELEQFSSVFNVLRISAEKTFKLGKSWFWHADVYFQQVIGNSPVNLPLIYTRNRFAYEGNLGFKNLNIAMGFEMRYHTPYTADGYSPILGQFFSQDSIRVSNPLPDIAAYLHFRIRSFKLYVRTENLNTAEFDDGFGFTRNNMAAPAYPYPGIVFRLGIYWSFVN